MAFGGKLAKEPKPAFMQASSWQLVAERRASSRVKSELLLNSELNKWRAMICRTRLYVSEIVAKSGSPLPIAEENEPVSSPT